MDSEARPFVGAVSVQLFEHLNKAEGDVWLISPFIRHEACTQILRATENRDVRCRVITRLDPVAAAQGFLSVDGLQRFLDRGFSVSHVPGLHAKAVLMAGWGYLGSSNLTGAGLGFATSPNIELNVELDSDDVARVAALVGQWPTKPVHASDLAQLASETRTLRVPLATTDPAASPVAPSRLTESLLSDARDPQRTLWVKMEHGEPKLGRWRGPSWFASPAKGRPSIKPGDLVFICSKPTHQCYAVLEVTSEPEWKPADAYDEFSAEDLERWPWISRTRGRLVPDVLLDVTLDELGVNGRGLQNGHVGLTIDQFAAGLQSISRLTSQ